MILFVDCLVAYPYLRCHPAVSMFAAVEIPLAEGLWDMAAAVSPPVWRCVYGLLGTKFLFGAED